MAKQATITKKPGLSALRKAQHALSKTLTLLEARNGQDIITLLKPALKALRDLEDYEHEQALMSLYLAVAYATIGDYKEAFDSLESAYALADCKDLQQAILDQRDEFCAFLEKQESTM